MTVKISKKIIAILLTFVMLAGTASLITLNDTDPIVWMIQKRLIGLNYYSFKSTGTFGGMTKNAIINFQSENSLMADGTVGAETIEKLFSNQVIRAPIAGSIPIGPAAAPGDVPPVLGEAADWFETVDAKMGLNFPYTVTDLVTQKTFEVVRVAGINHAKIEVAKAEDQAIFLEVFGGEYNWSKRPVLINIGTVNYAASLQGFPSGVDHVSGNAMEGSCEMYFAGSLSDVVSIPDPEHRLAVTKASSENLWKN